MNDTSDMDWPDYDIAMIFCEDVNRYPARKTSQRVGERDKRCMALHQEARWNSLCFVSDSFCLGLCSDCSEPCSLYEDGIVAGV